MGGVDIDQSQTPANQGAVYRLWAVSDMTIGGLVSPRASKLDFDANDWLRHMLPSAQPHALRSHPHVNRRLTGTCRWT